MPEKSEIEFKIATPSSRVSTDRICTIIGALFAIAMFVASNVMWNRCTKCTNKIRIIPKTLLKLLWSK